ncbi:type IV toxin-antitoxin system AbiEi family antitoxin domain-containing protein [Nocardioidaceae bacterium]|nr:type IV toxin-antitoxin system AbiEi family antitoxin domain-containing protein [Nocardioidaceae bacterium]
MRSRDILDLLERQTGVISRNQVLALEGDDNDLRRLVRQRRLVRLHRGVYVNHTGRPSWMQQAWAGLLAVGRCETDGSASERIGAVLGGNSALRADCGPGSRWSSAPIEVLTDDQRHVSAPEGVVIKRIGDLDRVARWNLGPPRATVEHATVSVAARLDPLDAIAVLTAATGSRMTTADRLRTELDARVRVSGRGWIESVLQDMAQGTCSALEHGYLTLVERPHGLTGARRQVRDRMASGAVYRDVTYDGLIVELDGLQHAQTVHRDADLDRDLDAALSGERTVRLGWGQVFERPCRTASRLARLLPHVPMHPCSSGCLVARADAA